MTSTTKILGRVVADYERRLDTARAAKRDAEQKRDELREAVFAAGRTLKVCLAPSRPRAVLDAIVTHCEVVERLDAAEDHRRQALRSQSTACIDLDAPNRERFALAGKHVKAIAELLGIETVPGDACATAESILRSLRSDRVDSIKVLLAQVRQDRIERQQKAARRGVYFAAPWGQRRHINEIAALAREHVQVNSTWHDGDKERGPNKPEVAEAERNLARNEIAKSACLIAFDTGSSKGLWYEVGIADALGVDVLLVSRTSNGVSLPDSFRRLWRYSNDPLLVPLVTECTDDGVVEVNCLAPRFVSTLRDIARTGRISTL